MTPPQMKKLSSDENQTSEIRKGKLPIGNRFFATPRAEWSSIPQNNAAITAAWEPCFLNFFATSKGVLPAEFLTFLSAPDSRSAYVKHDVRDMDMFLKPFAFKKTSTFSWANFAPPPEPHASSRS
eukprot:CAMPEP_0204221882 /NCGR_PEP_ID=MMETSP0361-20130328/81873_1 /ASSEMBLY_ACC=CAM_ASM_000343 /TAXON_ID=268821 /ORGANISM="Scrippsiella Hangoei, Strain SHTV-5" /LENGTH=124 /DNA_ID=CAMNT_0051187425 /DNA_START=115 /DNA_END=487 /DNA_ORIENTATION=+